MRISRRTLLGAGGTTIATALSGCVYHGPFKYTRLEASVRDSFEAESPVSVPVTVDVTVQNVGSRDVALRGVELACYDVDRELLATEPVGDFAWREAEPTRREREEHDVTWGTTTSYSAAWTLETEIEVDAVPEWISFRVGEVWFGDEDGDSQSAVVGTARASSPPRELSARVERFAAARPPVDHVSPDDYERMRTRGRNRVTGLLLPRPTPARLWYDHEGQRAVLGDAIAAFAAETAYRIEHSRPETREREPSDVLAETGVERPHLVALSHPEVSDGATRGLLADQSDRLEIQPQEAFVDPASDAGTIEGRTIGVPYALETVALLYNRELVTEPPETVVELTDRMDRHHDPASGTYGLSYPRLGPFAVSGWARAFGGYYYDEASDAPGLTDPATVRGIEFVAEELIPYVSAGETVDDSDGAFVAGTAPFAIGGPGLATRAANNGVDVGVTTLPEPADGSPRPSVVVDLLAFTSRLRTPNGRDATAAATAFAEWYATNEATHRHNAAARGTVPALADAIDSDELPAPIEGFATSAGRGTLELSASTMRAVYPPLQAALDAVFAGDSSAATALAEAEATIERN